MPHYSVSIQMRGSQKATPAVTIRAPHPEGAYEVASQIAETFYHGANRPEGPEFLVSVCDEDFEIHNFQNFEDEHTSNFERICDYRMAFTCEECKESMDEEELASDYFERTGDDRLVCAWCAEDGVEIKEEAGE